MEPEKLPPPDPMPSLADRLGAAARRRREPARRGLPMGVLLALALPVGAAGAAAIVGYFATAEIARLGRPSTAPDPARAERRTLETLGAGSFAAEVDRVARLLPPEARLQSVEVDRQDEQPRLLADIATADPDRLRAALSRYGGPRPLRVVNERRGDGVMIVSIEGRP